MKPVIELTPYGFKWGAAKVTRMCSEDRRGWVCMAIATKKTTLQINVLKGGKIHIHDGVNEWKATTQKN